MAIAPLPAGAGDVPSHHGGLENLDEEHAYWIDDVEGDVPRDLTGTFFRNGPGRQRVGGSTYGHWFDGDGMVCAFSVVDGRVHFRNRYVRTRKYVRETAAGQILHRGFGTQVPGGAWRNVLRIPASPANTNIMWHGGHLLALNEGGKPWELDPADLSTVGQFTYDGGLALGDVFGAHGKVHPPSGDYVNFGAGISGLGRRGLKPCLTLFRIRPDGRLAERRRVPIDTFPFCHDFALTRRHAVFFIGSIGIRRMLPVILGTRSISDQVGFDAATPMTVLVIELATLSLVRRFETAPGAVIHFGNAWEEGPEIVVDGMFTGDFDVNRTLANPFDPHGRFGGNAFMRYRLDLDAGRLTSAPICDTESEFPTFNTALVGRRHAVTYTACSVPNGADGFFNAMQRITHDGDAILLELPHGLYGSEPLFAPRRDATAEDDGYLLAVVYDGFAHRSELRIHRADTLELQAILRLRHHIPHQFHGHFTPEVFLR